MKIKQALIPGKLLEGSQISSLRQMNPLLPFVPRNVDAIQTHLQQPALQRTLNAIQRESLSEPIFLKKLLIKHRCFMKGGIFVLSINKLESLRTVPGTQWVLNKYLLKEQCHWIHHTQKFYLSVSMKPFNLKLFSKSLILHSQIIAIKAKYSGTLDTNNKTSHYELSFCFVI